MPLNIPQCAGSAPTAKSPPGHQVTSIEGDKPCFTQLTTPAGTGLGLETEGPDCLMWSVTHMHALGAFAQAPCVCDGRDI